MVRVMATCSSTSGDFLITSAIFTTPSPTSLVTPSTPATVARVTVSSPCSVSLDASSSPVRSLEDDLAVSCAWLGLGLGLYDQC